MRPNSLALSVTCLVHDFGSSSSTLYLFSCQPETASDVRSGVAVGEVRLNVRVNSGDSSLNRSWDMRLVHFVMGRQRRTTDGVHHGNRWKQHLAFGIWSSLRAAKAKPRRRGDKHCRHYCWLIERWQVLLSHRSPKTRPYRCNTTNKLYLCSFNWRSSQME